MAQFSNAQHVIVNGGTFNSARGDIHFNNIDQESGLHILRLAVSHGAIHDSAERYPPPKCHPDTRKAVRQIILDWVANNESSALPFFWLYGPAGAGKTAILQAIAEFLCNSSECDGDLGGSFFFSRGKYGRDQGHFLFSTIAYQLALNVPGLRQHVNRIMDANPTLHTKSLAVQLQALIVDAFQSLSPLPQRPYLVIIDGLDECQDKATQQLILSLLCETITDRKLPLRFLIGSRPESHIRATFDQKALYTITQRVVLDETFNPGRDIQIFLQDGFAEICTKHADILSHLEQPWPAKGIIDLLVQRSSGQFIYATTVLKFVGADFCSPTKQLALILKLDSTAFSDLDQLYTQILSVYPSTANIVQVLGIIVGFDAMTSTPEVIEDILGMEEGEVKLMLRGLSSLIAFVGDKNEYLTKGVISNVGSVYLIHASFRDYLVDSSRSGVFYVNEQEYRNWATRWSFSLITKWIGRSWRIPSTTRLPHSKTWHYFNSYLAQYFIDSPKLVKDAIMTDINDLVQEFWKISSDGPVAVFFIPIRCLMDILKHVVADAMFGGANYCESLRVFLRCQKMLDQSFTSAFLKSRDMGDLLGFLPGIVVQNNLTMQGMADLYRVKVDLLESLSKWTLEPFFKQIPSDVGNCSFYRLEDYLSGFLRDRNRSDLYYCDPMLHHVLICRQVLSLLPAADNIPDLQSNDLPAYVQSNFYKHLCAATEVFLSGQNVFGDHPAVEILNDLDRITYSHLDVNQSHPISHLVSYTIQSILMWENMLNKHLKGMTVSISGSSLIGRMGQVTDRIYRQILCIEIHGSMTTITISAPFRIPRRVIPETSLYRAANPGVIQISWELLDWVSVEGRIPSSFSNFMTTPERSGPLYISPDVYHTQITEYSLETIFRYNNKSDSFRPSPFSHDNNHCLAVDWSFEEHISRAHPTEMIIYLLRLILLHPTYQYIPKLTSIINLLYIIIKWLEGLGSERPGSLYDALQAELHRHWRKVTGAGLMFGS